MRGRVAVGVFLLVAFSAPADAGPLAFVGNLHLQIGRIGIDIPGAGNVTVDSTTSPTRFWLEAGAFPAVAVVAPVPSSIAPTNYPIVSLQITIDNARGSFSIDADRARGVMPLPGVAKVCLFGPCAAPLANVEVPLSVVGQPDARVDVTGPVNVTVAGAPWVTGTVIARPPPVPYAESGPTLVTRGHRHGPAGLRGSTFQHGGTIQLVTPVAIRTNLAIQVPAYASLTFVFAPEASTLTLLGGGIAALAAAGARASQRRSS
jgi:hypothetical protein